MILDFYKYNTALYKIIINKPLLSAVCSFIIELIYMSKTLSGPSGCLRELIDRNKVKV